MWQSGAVISCKPESLSWGQMEWLRGPASVTLQQLYSTTAKKQ